MHKRVFTTALALISAVCLLAGCGGGTASGTTPGGTTPEGTTPGGSVPGGETPGGTIPGGGGSQEEIGEHDYLTHGEMHTDSKNYPAGDHVWNENNECTVCGYKLPVTEGLRYTDTEGGLKAGYDWENETLAAAETLVIPAYHNGKKVVAVQGYYGDDGETASETRFAGAAFKTVAVPNTVKSVPTFTFFGNEALETAYIGGGALGNEVFAASSVKKAFIKAQSVGDMTFIYEADDSTVTPCPIEEAEIDCTGAIGSYTFYTCPNLVKAKIAGETVGDCTFYRCAALEEAEITRGAFGERTFQECKKLKKASLPDDTTIIPKGTFWNCYSLYGFDLPQTVTEIGDDAFNGCIMLTHITLPATLQTAGTHSFRFCRRLAEICNLSELEIQPHKEDVGHETSYLGIYTETVVNGKSQMGTFTTKDNFLFYKSAAGKNYLVYYFGDETELTLPAAAPDGSKYAVNTYAFYQFAFTSVVTGDGVTELCYGAFNHCDQLTSITFGASLEKIGDYCFNSVPLLTEVTFPASLNYIGERAFWTSKSAEGLQSATFAEPTGWTWKGDVKKPVDLSDPAQNAQYLAHTSNSAPNLYWQRTES